MITKTKIQTKSCLNEWFYKSDLETGFVQVFNSMPCCEVCGQRTILRRLHITEYRRTGEPIYEAKLVCPSRRWWNGHYSLEVFWIESYKAWKQSHLFDRPLLLIGRDIPTLQMVRNLQKG